MFIIGVQVQSKINDTSCKARPYLKYVDKLTSPTFNDQPTIIVYECSGYEGTYNNFLCVPTITKVIKTQHGGNTFNNHTRCEMKCVCNVSQHCRPEDKYKGEVPCPIGSR